MRKVAVNQTKRSKITMTIGNGKMCNLIEMEHDGSSMHKAIVQQVFELCSTQKKREFNRRVQKFREDVADHIEKKFDDYINSITSTLYNLDTSNSLEMVTPADCLSYLKEKMKLPATLGGEETLKATAELLNVNILQLSQDSTEYSFYNKKHERTILLAYRDLQVKQTRNEPEHIVIMTVFSESMKISLKSKLKNFSKKVRKTVV